MTTVPSNHIKRMCGKVVWKNHIILFDQNFEVTFFVMGNQVLRYSNIAFTKRGMFKQLAKMVYIPFWKPEWCE